jgi:hypothetical protein
MAALANMSYMDSRFERLCLALQVRARRRASRNRKIPGTSVSIEKSPVFISYFTHTHILRYYIQLFEPQCTQEVVFEEISQLLANADILLHVSSSIIVQPTEYRTCRGCHILSSWVNELDGPGHTINGTAT